MAAVAQRRVEETRQQTTVTGTRRVRRARPRRRAWARYRPMFSLIAGVLGLGLVLGWMSVYGRLAVAGYNRSELVAACRQEQLKNQRLKLKLDSLTSPQSVVAAAQKAGMVYATEYEYLGKPPRLADAGRGAGE